MNRYVVGNHDRCGRCRLYHPASDYPERAGTRLRHLAGGNDHYCRVHGAVSPGCCPSSCNLQAWDWIQYEGAVPKGTVPPPGYHAQAREDGGQNWWSDVVRPSSSSAYA